MGPTNQALVKLFLADQQLRAAKTRLDVASKDVRVQERRVNDLIERHRLSHAKLQETQAQARGAELDLKARDERIERFRSQQQNAKNNKEYQAFLIEISTEKADKAKLEEQTLQLMEAVEQAQQQHSDLAALLEAEREKLKTLKQSNSEMLSELEAEIQQRQPARDEAAAAVPARARDQFERLAEHHDGEAVAPITKPDKRREEYVCGACHMELVVDVYNKLHTRDDLVFCPSCRRMLYIPEELPPEAAVNKKKVSRPKKIADVGAAPRRGEIASDVLRSVEPDSEESVADSASEIISTPSAIGEPASESHS